MDVNLKRAQRLLVSRSATWSDESQAMLASSLVVDSDATTMQRLALSPMLVADSMIDRARQNRVHAKLVDC